ncbi:MAG TPA: hypothetical protein VHT04_18570 [Stellaceae bacterium]|nr:hypothetical protein [Stellaceae bacterium]
MQRTALLAPPGGARWRLDSLLDFDVPVTTLGDQTINAKVTYVLRDVATGAVVFNKVVETSSTRQPMLSAGTEVAVAVLAGGVMGQQRRMNAVDTAVRGNLDGFLTVLAEWDSARQ